MAYRLGEQWYTPEHPIRFPYVVYSEMVDHFTGDVCALIRQYPGWELKQYEAILEENGLHWDKESMSGAVVEGLDARLHTVHLRLTGSCCLRRTFL